MKKPVIVALHAAYWILYLLVVSTFILVVPYGNGHSPLDRLARILFLSPLSLRIILPALIGFYTFYSFLFDKYLDRKKIAALLFSGLLISFFCALAFMFIPEVLFHDLKDPEDWDDKVSAVIFLSALVFIHGCIGLIMKGFITWYNDIRLKAMLIEKNHEMELDLISSRINPHFLFNTINNIDVLILKDAQKASAYLNKLSGIMRFMLYETGAVKIPLTKELDYVEKYIDLQKIRTSNMNYADYSLTGYPDDTMIVPMLLIPFIENAFKYAESIKDSTSIIIHIDVDKERLVFTCENGYSQNDQVYRHGGIGNELIKKRLQLLYPGSHTLAVENRNSLYNVKLVLQLNEN